LFFTFVTGTFLGDIELERVQACASDEDAQNDDPQTYHLCFIIAQLDFRATRVPLGDYTSMI
jgi:hypothetical protein